MIFTATELADAIGVSPKAFRSFVRSMVRANGGTVGADTPGSGARYRFECDDDAVDQYVESIRTAYASHRRTNGSRVVDLTALMGGDDANGA